MLFLFSCFKSRRMTRFGLLLSLISIYVLYSYITGIILLSIILLQKYLALWIFLRSDFLGEKSERGRRGTAPIFNWTKNKGAVTIASKCKSDCSLAVWSHVTKPPQPCFTGKLLLPENRTMRRFYGDF